MGSENPSQTTSANSEQIDARDYQTQLLAEYNALRSEAIHRMGVRHQIVAFSVVVLGAVLAFNAQPNTLVAYPILGLFLALGWAHNDFRIGEIGEYVRTNIENKLPGLNWEKHFFNIKKKERPFRYVLRATILSAGGIIVGTQILALVVPFFQQTAPRPNLLWVPIDGVAIVFTAIVLHWRKMVYRKKCCPEKAKRMVLFIPNSELREYFRNNTRQDLKVVTPAIMTEALAAKLQRRRKETKTEVPLNGVWWTHSSAKEPNKICEALDFTDESISSAKTGPVAISFANVGSIETFHRHKEHWEVYFSEQKLGVQYRLPGEQQVETKTMDEGGAVLFAPGVAHRMEIHGLTMVLELPAVKGDREVQ